MEIVKNQEELNKRVKMFESLGIFYDSAYERDAIQARSASINGTFNAKFEEYDNSVRFKCEKAELRVDSEDKTYTLDGGSGYYGRRGVTNFFDAINGKISNFITPKDKVKWSGKVTYNGKTKEFTHRATKFSASELLKFVMSDSNVIPSRISFELGLEVDREGHARKEYYLENACSELRMYNRTAYKSAEDIFKQITNPDFEKRNNRWNSRNGNYNFKGQLKSLLAHQNNRTLCFLLDYLYGKKVATNTKRVDLQTIVATLGRNTFGLFDVRDLAQLLNIMRYKYGVPNMAERLHELGIEPARKKEAIIKRWKLDESIFNSKGDN